MNTAGMERFLEESGSPEAGTILFLHGGGVGGWMWQEVIENLPEFHCLAPDLPEHGRNQSGPFSISGAAEAAANLIRLKSPDGEAHVVGLSLGAQVAVAILSQAPEVVKSAVISSALLYPLPGAGLGFYHPLSLALVYWTMLAPFKRWDAWIRLNARYSAGVPQRFFEHFRRDFQNMSRDAWVRLMSENLSFRLPPGLESFQKPVLVIAGQKEHAAMRRSAQALLEALPQAVGVRVKHDGSWSMAEEHNWALKAPDLFAEVVRAWVSGAPLPEQMVPLTQTPIP